MSKKVNLPTFSVNEKVTDDKQKKVFDLIEQINDQNRDTVGEAFIRIIEGKKSRLTPASLNQYAKDRKNYQIKEDAKEKKISLDENLEEFEIGKLSSSIPTVRFEDEVIRRCDTEYMVNRFLDLRQEWYFGIGYDIARLLGLSLLLEDFQARLKLQMVFEKQKEMEFLKELLENPEAIEKIKDMFWEKLLLYI